MCYVTFLALALKSPHLPLYLPLQLMFLPSQSNLQKLLSFITVLSHPCTLSFDGSCARRATCNTPKGHLPVILVSIFLPFVSLHSSILTHFLHSVIPLASCAPHPTHCTHLPPHLSPRQLRVCACGGGMSGGRRGILNTHPSTTLTFCVSNPHAFFTHTVSSVDITYIDGKHCISPS